MSSTNKTTNYELSQFIGADKPAWLGDYNTDMSKIDTAIHNASTTATGADGKATANTTAIGDLTSLTTTDKTSVVNAINEVRTDAGTAQSTANSASLLANTNKNDIATIKSTFNLSAVTKYTDSDVSLSGCNQFGGEITIARDNTGEIFKIYGNFNVVPTIGGGSEYNITLSNTGIETDASYHISPVGISTGNDIVDSVSITVNNNSIVVKGTSRGNGVRSYGRLFPCIYFNTDFGDTPE